MTEETPLPSDRRGPPKHRNVGHCGAAPVTSAELLEILGGTRSELGAPSLPLVSGELCRRTNRRKGPISESGTDALHPCHA